MGLCRLDWTPSRLILNWLFAATVFAPSYWLFPALFWAAKPNIPRLRTSMRDDVGKAPGHKISDRELVAAMARGDADALRALSARYARMLGALAYRFVKDESDAEEIAADTLWQAWREAPLFDPGRSSVSAWLVMLGRSRAIDRYRAARARRSPENPQPQPEPVADALSELESAERAKLVKTAVGRLEARERELLELAYFSDLSQTEIAEKVGIPLGTVKTRMRTALIKLRDALRRLR